MAFRAKLRHRWRSWLAIAVLISVVGGLVLAATAAGRRTEAAFPQFVAAHGYDSDEYATRPVPKVAELPGVTSAVELVGPDSGQPLCACTHPINPTDFGVIFLPSTGRSPFKLVSGRLPDPSSPDQVLASFTLQQDAGVHLGSVIRVPFYARSQAAAYNDATGAEPKPTGPTVDFHVVGFEASEFEFPSGETPSYDLFTTSAFAKTVMPRTPVDYVYLVSLRDGSAGISRFTAAAVSLNGAGLEGSQDEDGAAAAIATSIHPQAIGWWILAVLAALVGLAVVGQALARQSRVESEDYPTMAALGANRRQLVALGMAQTLVLGLVGAVGAVAVAFLLSPIAPLGEARIAENSTGFAFDGPVLLLGALAMLAAVLVLGLWPALRAAKARRSDDHPILSGPSVVVTQLAAAGAPERGHRRPQRAGAKDRWGHRAVGERPPRHGAGCPGSGGDGGIRRQPFAPDRHPPAVRGYLPTQLYRPLRREAEPRPSAKPRARQSRHGNHGGHRHRDPREQDNGGDRRRHGRPRPAALLDRHRTPSDQ
jgi:hypothetical protein